MATLNPVGRMTARLSEWLTAGVPKGRIAAFRTVIYLYVAVDITLLTNYVRQRVSVPGSLYEPLLVGRILPLPTPNEALVTVIFWALLITSIAAATGRAPRLLGWTVFALYLEWMIIAFSYGKVDHGRFGLLVALATLPLAGAARHGDTARTEAGGWCLRSTQMAVIATYFLAAFAKLRFGGVEWLTSATYTKAVLRRGTALANWLLDVPGVLVAAQIGTVAFELASPLVFFVRERLRLLMVAGFYLFHLTVFASITISFIAHQAAMTSFLPLEKVRPIVWSRRLLGRLGRRDREMTAQPIQS